MFMNHRVRRLRPVMVVPPQRVVRHLRRSGQSFLSGP